MAKVRLKFFPFNSVVTAFANKVTYFIIQNIIWGFLEKIGIFLKRLKK